MVKQVVLDIKAGFLQICHGFHLKLWFALQVGWWWVAQSMLLGIGIHGNIPGLKDSEVVLHGGHLDDSRCVPWSIGWVFPWVANGSPNDVTVFWEGCWSMVCGFTVAGCLHTSLLLEPTLALCNFMDHQHNCSHISLQLHCRMILGFDQ